MTKTITIPTKAPIAGLRINSPNEKLELADLGFGAGELFVSVWDKVSLPASVRLGQVSGNLLKWSANAKAG